MTRILRIFGGLALIIAGVAMLVLPGPGILTIIAGLAVIGKELTWANRLSIWARDRLTGTPRQS